MKLAEWVGGAWGGSGGAGRVGGEGGGVIGSAVGEDCDVPTYHRGGA